MTGERPEPRAWRNWSGLHALQSTSDASPTTAAEVAAEVRRAVETGTTVKMTGTGHSCNAIGVPGHTWLRPRRLTGIVDVDRAAMTVTARSGTTLRVLNAELERLGLSLRNMGETGEPTLAGAVSTGTHGTGGTVASLSAQVVGLELVTGTGEVLRATAEEHPDVLEMARLGLGALGILTAITLRVEPVFLIEAVERPLRWAEALGSLNEITGSADHVALSWLPHTDRLLARRHTRAGTDLSRAQPPHRLRPRPPRSLRRRPGARSHLDVAHRVLTTSPGVPRVVFNEMEYAVPRAAGAAALREVRRVLDASDLRLSLPVGIRVAPADDVPLSTAHHRDSTYLSFRVHHTADHRPLLASLEPVLRAHDGRPHWGTLHTRTAADLAPAYPRFADFLALRDRLDPHRVLGNAHLSTVLGD